MNTHRVLLTIVAALAAIAIGWYVWDTHYDPGLAVVDALDRLRIAQASDAEGRAVQHLVEALRQNFLDTRADATRWSAVFWGTSFLGLLASAVGALVLKVDSWSIDDKKRKDWGAGLAGVAALAVSISAAGDFKHKWQANRLAAAKFELSGYQLLAAKNPSVGDYYEKIGEIQFERATLITGEETPEKPASAASETRRAGRTTTDPEPPGAPSAAKH